jgi:hypothetical protein
MGPQDMGKPTGVAPLQRVQHPFVFAHRQRGTCVAGESCAPHWSGGNTTHDDWPANMILG